MVSKTVVNIQIKFYFPPVTLYLGEVINCASLSFIAAQLNRSFLNRIPKHVPTE